MANLVGSPFTYLCYDLATGNLITQLPLEGVSFSSILNTPGQFSAQIDLTDPRLQEMDAIIGTAPNRTMICVDYNGALIWGGQVKTRRWQRTTRQLLLGGQELWSWFAQRVQANDYSIVPTYWDGSTMQYWTGASFDAGMIAAQVITDALTPPITSTATTNFDNVMTGTTTGIMFGMPVSGSGIPAGTIVIGASPTTVNISQAAVTGASATYTFGTTQNNIVGGLSIMYNGASPSTWTSFPPAPSTNWVGPTYPISSVSTIDSIVTQLSNLGLNVGFDFMVDVAYSGVSGSPPKATINLSYPQRGRTIANNGLVVDLSSSAVFDYEFPEDGSQAGIVTYAVGGSAGGVSNGYGNTNPLQQGYPLTEQVASEAAVINSAVLQELAQAQNAISSYPIVVATVTMTAFGAEPQFGDFIIGDQIQVIMPPNDQDGEVFDPRFANGMNQTWRITQYDMVVPDDGGPVTMKLTLNIPLQLTATASPI